MMNISRGEIWLINFNPTIGREQSGIRPGLIISVNEFNKSKAEKVIALPLSSKYKGIPLNIEIKPPEGGLSKLSYVKTEDIRSISVNRLIEKWGDISLIKMKEVEQKIKLLLGI